ncbi:MAG: hypothetical protein ABSH41_14090 [Syntrophobacteraceae bacterium]|jgi:hypothetical protein
MKPFFDPETDDVVSTLQKCEALLAAVHGFLFVVTDDNDAWALNREAFTGMAHVTFEVRSALREIVDVVQMKHVEEMVRIAAEKRAEAQGDSAPT